MRMLLPLCLATALVSSESPEVLVQRVAQAAQQVNAMRFAFVQEKRLAMLEEPLCSSGVIEIDRLNSRLRWQYERGPVIIFAEGRVRRWGVDGVAESTAGQAAQAMSAQLQAMTSGDWSGLRELFELHPGGSEGEIMLRPKGEGMARYMASLSLTFRVDGSPATLRLNTQGGDVTDYRFAPPDVAWIPDPARFAGP
jgi:hypothetical protein